MSSKFFNNVDITLFDKFKGIAENMQQFERFLAVAGYFRSSGYFKLREELTNVQEIKIIVGINIDDAFRRRNRQADWVLESEKAKELYGDSFKQDILDARYAPEIERGILQMCEDLAEGRLEMRIHSSKNLHAKFYLCLPMTHTENSDGWVIMGSSNLTDAGLGITKSPRYELNVAMKDYDDVKYCYDEFVRLWDESVPFTSEDVEKNKKDTYLGYQPTPYEIYMKVLISVFGDQVEDDFTLELPDSVIDLKYQRDAVVQGYQIMKKHDGVFIADVVGLGKTLIATMIAKRFIEENGNKTKILVVYPPALEEHWKNTFKTFDIKKKTAKFISNGSLSKVMDDKEEFNLIIVDEAHGFRNDGSGKYDDLQKICKAPCENQGAMRLKKKKVLLLSATPINNSPEDLQNLLLLFQDNNVCTIDGIPSLELCFAPWKQRYKKIMAGRKRRDVTADVDKLYEEIRTTVIDKVTIRRTRNNILNSEDYREDIEKQGIKFPKIEKPQVKYYKMSPDTSNLFYRTISILSRDEEDSDDSDLIQETPHLKALTYARYRAVEFLKEEYRKKYPKNIGETLKGIYRVHMVKRLESSFFAFKKSLETLLRVTEDMIEMFDQNNILIIPDLKVSALLDKGLELDEILEKALEKGYTEDEVSFKCDDFQPGYLDMLIRDRDILKELNEEWKKEEGDPKFDIFRNGLEKEFYDDNESKKLVIFSESIDTLDYLFGRLTNELGKTDVLEVTSHNREKKDKTIKENFDANYSDQKDDFNIVLTSDVLAEGVNLHRSNVIINYDSPWNAIRLMQRVGRVNRIGSKADKIHNFMFYPSQQGEMEIGLYKNALIKLQGFHSAFGEDAQIYSAEEIVKEFELFDNNVKDSVDDKIKFLREARELHNSSPDLYEKIKRLPVKSRVMRASQKNSGKTIVFVQSNVKTEFYEATDKTIKEIDFIEAANILKAKQDEKAVPFSDDKLHYELVNKTVKQFSNSYEKQVDTLTVNAPKLNKNSMKARNFINRISQTFSDDIALVEHCHKLIGFIEMGRYNQLPGTINKFTRRHKIESNSPSIEANRDLIIEVLITPLILEYGGKEKINRSQSENTTEAQIIISESFV